MSLYTFEVYRSTVTVDDWDIFDGKRFEYVEFDTYAFYTDFLPALVFTILLGIYIFRTYVLKTNEKPDNT